MKITARTEPEDTTDKIIWSSSNQNIATISEDGIITAKAKGQAIITASCGDYTETCSITSLNFSSTITESDYGKTVTGYTCPNSSGVNSWMLFYTDDTNIYLISSNELNHKYVPAGKNGTAISSYSNSTPWLDLANSVANDYTGSSDIKDPRIKALNNDYFNIKKYSSTSTSMKSVAYLLDINVWKKYTGDNAEYAIGTPTIELFLKSYNKKYGTKFSSKAVSNVGYQISDSTGQKWDNGRKALSGIINVDDRLYWTGKPGANDGLHLATPIAYESNLVYLDYYGYFRYRNWGSIRPIVCLKSDVKLKLKSDGSYLIE